MMERSPEELALMRSQTGLSDQLRRQGSDLFGSAMPGIQNTLGYYNTLLSGNRAARMGAVGQEAEDVAGAFAGADKAVGRRLVGGERDQALAENARARAGQISRLTTGVRPQAAGAMANLGTNLIGAGAGMQGASGDIGARLLSNSTNNRQQANQFGLQAGQNTTSQLGSLMARLMGSFNMGGNRQVGTVPNIGRLMPGRTGSQISY